MAKCTHKTHRKNTVGYRDPKSKDRVIDIEEGYNPVRDRWEHCDKGLFDDPKIRVRKLEASLGIYKLD